MKIVIGGFCVDNSITREQKIAIMTNPELIEVVDKLNKIYAKSKFGSLTMAFDKKNPNINIINKLDVHIQQIMFNMLKTNYSNDLQIEIRAKNRPFEIWVESDGYIGIEYMDVKDNVFTL
jgi:hypothetical protein